MMAASATIHPSTVAWHQQARMNGPRTGGVAFLQRHDLPARLLQRRRPVAQPVQAGAGTSALQTPGNDGPDGRDSGSDAFSSLQQRLLQLLPDALLLYWPVLQRMCVTVAMLAIIRMGYFIPLPGVDMQALPTAVTTTEGDMPGRQLPRGCAGNGLQGPARIAHRAPPAARAAPGRRARAELRCPPVCGGAGERMVKALYGQASALPAALFDLGISPHINASIVVAIVLMMPKALLPFRWADRLRDARKEGKGVSAAATLNWVATSLGGGPNPASVHADCMGAR